MSSDIPNWGHFAFNFFVPHYKMWTIMDNNTPIVKAIVKINTLMLEKPLGSTAMSVTKKPMRKLIISSSYQGFNSMQ